MLFLQTDPRSNSSFNHHLVTSCNFPHADISAPQFQAVRLASARHETRLRGGARAGFFLGDGEGVGVQGSGTASEC